MGSKTERENDNIISNIFYFLTLPILFGLKPPSNQNAPKEVESKIQTYPHPTLFLKTFIIKINEAPHN